MTNSFYRQFLYLSGKINMRITKSEREILRRIGSSGGKKAAKNMTPEQRKERATKAVRAREERRKLRNEHSASDSRNL